MLIHFSSFVEPSMLKCSFDNIAFLQIFDLCLSFAKLHRVRSLEWHRGVVIKHALHKQLEKGLFPMATLLKGVMTLP